MPRRSDSPIGRVRTYYELRQIIELKGAAAFVSRRYFDEDEVSLAAHQRVAWQEALPEVGTELSMTSVAGGTHRGAVTAAMVELYRGKVEVTGADAWRWLESPQPVAGE